MISFNKLKKKESETEEQYLWRIGQIIDSGQIKNWECINNIINTELGISEDKWRSESAFRKRYQSAKAFYENCFSKMENEAFSKEMAEQVRVVKKEKAKIQTEKLEYARWIREEARDELIMEKICDAIATLPSLDVPNHIIPKHGKCEYIICFGDEHFCSEFEIQGLYGEILNAYSPEIFMDRMWDLFNQIVEIVHKENVYSLNVFSMGDFSDGILRVSQLMKLRYGVVDGTIKYAEFICNWLNELSKYVRVKYQMTSGNHTELRLLGQQKGTFQDENMSKIIAEFIKVRLGNNSNFEFIENPTGYIYDTIAGYNILGIHGEVKNMEKAIKDFSNTYRVNIDYLIGGHLHHTKIEDVGVNREVINIPSIIGLDPYSLSLNKSANAAGKLLVFEQDKGLVCEYRLKLN